MRWFDYPLYRILAFLIAGIVISYYTDIALYLWCWFAIITSGITILFYFIGRSSPWNCVLFTFVSLLFFLGLGGVLHTWKTTVLPKNHFQNLVEKGENALIDLTLSEQLSSNTYNHRFYAVINSINKSSATGKVLVLFKRADSVDFQPGDRIVVYDDITDASNGRNPGDFDYKSYLEQIDVYGQIYVDLPTILNVQSDSDQLTWYVSLRNQLLEDLSNSNLNDNSRSLIEALVLGQRQNVDPKISQDFRDAGVIHILALSGLHVGILLLILQFGLSWLQYFKHGKLIRTLVIISLLWAFALLTGMSPSILRAVTMFTFVALGMSMNRKGSVFQSLTVSAFVLLLFDSRLLFQVGFQLSYLAVLSIVLLQPIFLRLIPRIKWLFPRYLWQIFTVTLAAQIGVAPLSVFYFHQLPLAFLVGNLILLCVLPVILALSILFIFLLQAGIPHKELGLVLNQTFQVVIDLVAYISSFDAWILKNLYCSFPTVIFVYLMILGLSGFIRPFALKSRRERLVLIRPNYGLHVAIASLCFLLGYQIYQINENFTSFTILHQSRGTAVAIANNAKGYLFTYIPSMSEERRLESLSRLSQVDLFRDKEVIVESLPAVLDFRGTQLVVIDGESVYLEADYKEPVLLLSHSPKINLDKVITQIKPSVIVADGSNYRNMMERWRKTCASRDIPFINTYETGAYALKKD